MVVSRILNRLLLRKAFNIVVGSCLGGCLAFTSKGLRVGVSGPLFIGHGLAISLNNKLIPPQQSPSLAKDWRLRHEALLCSLVWHTRCLHSICLLQNMVIVYLSLSIKSSYETSLQNLVRNTFAKRVRRLPMLPVLFQARTY